MRDTIDNINIGDYVSVEMSDMDKYDFGEDHKYGKVISLDPFKIKNEEYGTINIDNEDFNNIMKEFELGKDQEEIVDKLYNINNMDDIERIDIVSAQQVLNNSGRDKIFNINDKIALYKSKYAYNDLAKYWIYDYESTGKIFKLHNKLIDKLADIEMDYNDYKNWMYIEYPDSEKVKSYKKFDTVYFIDTV